MRAGAPPPRGYQSGRLMRMAGIFGMLVGAAIIVGVATGKLEAAGDPFLGYMVGGTTTAYGLLRYLMGVRSDKKRSSPPLN